METEERICVCGCNKIFIVKTTSKRRYINGHFCKGKTWEEIYGNERTKNRRKNIKVKKPKKSKVKTTPGYYNGKLYIEKTCACGCNEKFICVVTNKNEYINGHRNNLWFCKKECDCGCGNHINWKPHFSYTGWPKFILGHCNKVNNPGADKLRGKTYKQIYGEKKAKEIIEKKTGIKFKHKKSSVRKGKTYKQIYGDKKAKQIILKRNEKFKKKGIMWSKEKILEQYLKLPKIKKSEWNVYRKKNLVPDANIVRKIFGSFEKLEEISKKEFIFKENTKSRKGKSEDFILDIIEKEKNIKLKRQFYVDRKYVDGYDPINNIVYEVDELHHKYNKVQDYLREQKIKDKLNCNFIRINEHKFLRMINQSILEDFNNETVKN